MLTLAILGQAMLTLDFEYDFILERTHLISKLQQVQLQLGESIEFGVPAQAWRGGVSGSDLQIRDSLVKLT